MFFQSLGKRTDEELMRMIASGNQRALTELYARYSSLLLRYFFRMLWKDLPRAQDFLQDIFLKVIEHPEHFNPDKRFSTWIYSVAHNMCKNEYRKQAYREAHREQSLKSPVLFIAPAEDLDFQSAMDRVMRELDEEERHLYSLRFELELSLEEIAEMLGCPVGTVKSRTFYLKKKLAGKLAENYPETERYGTE
jgi:RNA polymerase sigma-70 factor, ECF subfamily